MSRLSASARLTPLRISSRRIQINYESIYLFTFLVFCVSSEISSSLFSFAGILAKLVRLFCCGVLGFLWMQSGKLTPKRLLLHFVVLAFFTAAAFFAGRSALLVISLFIMTAGRVDKKKIVRTSMIGTFSTAVCIILACFAGVLPDRTYFHEGMIAHSLGFTYYSAYPYVFLFNFLSLIYVSERKLRWLELGASLALNYVLFRYSSLRLSFYLWFAVVAVYIIMEKARFLDLNKRWIKALSFIVFPACFALAVWASLDYSPGSAFWRKTDELLSGRVGLSNLAFHRYSVKLFGQVVENNNMKDGQIIYENYFYIDSGYIYALLGYGLLLTALLIAIYTFLLHRACENNDKKLFLWLVTLAVFTVINNVWVSIHYNALLVLLIPYLSQRQDPLGILQKWLPENWLHGSWLSGLHGLPEFDGVYGSYGKEKKPES